MIKGAKAAILPGQIAADVAIDGTAAVLAGQLVAADAVLGLGQLEAGQLGDHRGVGGHEWTVFGRIGAVETVWAAISVTKESFSRENSKNFELILRKL